MGYSYRSRRGMWAGTLERLQWWPTPLRGADSSPTGWGSGGVMLNGGGYEFRSWGSHRVFQYEWGESLAREDAQMIHNYYNGTFGRGLIYFLDPLTWMTNVLPARVADPSLALESEGSSFVYGVDPTSVVTSGGVANGLPVQSAYYNLTSVPAGFRGVEDATFIPIPEGHTLYLGAFYSSTGSGGIFASPHNSNGSIGTAVRLSELSNDSTTVVNTEITGVKGVWIWLGKSANDAATVTATALIARVGLTPEEDSTAPGFGEGSFGEDPFGGIVSPVSGKILNGPWVGGQGNSGVRFSGAPTFVNNSPIGGGRIGLAATFREVGSWIYN